LCAAARRRFAGETSSRQFQLVDRAIWTEPDRQVPFHVRDDKTIWSSVFLGDAERDRQSSRAVEVRTTTIPQLFQTFGIPYYLKSDIEGADRIVAEQLVAVPERPPFVSLEFGSLQPAALLREAGYDRFQIVNQGHLRLWRPPRPAREGRYVEAAFHDRTSGLFGLELEPGYWFDYAGLEARFERWQRLPRMNRLAAFAIRHWGKLTNRGWLIGRGWLDLHATTERALRAAALQR
jgi:FkbM family methyltransferase